MIIGWLNFSRAPTALPYQCIQYCKPPLGRCPIFLILNVTELILFILSLVRHSSRETQVSMVHTMASPQYAPFTLTSICCASRAQATKDVFTLTHVLMSPIHGEDSGEGSTRRRFRPRNLPAQTFPLASAHSCTLAAVLARDFAPEAALPSARLRAGVTKRETSRRSTPVFPASTDEAEQRVRRGCSGFQLVSCTVSTDQIRHPCKQEGALVLYFKHGRAGIACGRTRGLK